MNVIASTIINGPEAKGIAEITDDNGKRALHFSQGFWVAPGAPDVTIAFSSNPAGQLDNALTNIGLFEYSKPSKTFPLPDELDVEANSTVIVYCRQYSAHFGHGTLSFN